MSIRIGLDSGVEAPERAWLIACGRRYWLAGAERIAEIAVASTTVPAASRLARIRLPEWAADIGIGPDAALCVDVGSLVPGEAPPWERVDWWTAAFRHLLGASERLHDASSGPVHSYALRLRGVDQASFDHAWVNRIFLFLRRSAERGGARFDALPSAHFDLTHDVDAIRKTPELRLKQGAFQLVNALRLIARAEPRAAGARLLDGARFAWRSGAFDTWDEIRELEEAHRVRSVFHVYGGPAGGARHGRSRLIDPAYDANELAATLRSLHAGGWTIGVHPSFDSWRDADALRSQREAVERVVGSPVERCRQHWLRFSWGETWAAQERAGLTLDSTLGFNDRPGFRNGAALRFEPWSFERRAPLGIDAIPLVLMDSHLYDYELLTDEERRATMSRWVDEVTAVGGEASLLWHQQTMHPDYGWGAGYRELLHLVGGRS